MQRGRLQALLLTPGGLGSTGLFLACHMNPSHVAGNCSVRRLRASWRVQCCWVDAGTSSWQVLALLMLLMVATTRPLPAWCGHASSGTLRWQLLLNNGRLPGRSVL